MTPVRLGSLLIAFGLLAAHAHAASPAWPDALSPRLQAMKMSGMVKIGFREHAVPFSYRGPDGAAVGYSIDICREIVATLEEDLGRALSMRDVPVTPADRIAKVASGEVDLECGATTSTAERRKEVAFSQVIFVTGMRLAVPRSSAIRDVGALKGKRVAVVANTTAEATMREYDKLLSLGLWVVPAAGYAEALNLAAEGKADAVAADEVLMRGVLVETKRAGEFRIVGGLLSLEPYGIVYAKGDAALDDAVTRTVTRLAQSREIEWIYKRWFVRPLPSGQRMEMPMSPQLRRALELVGLPAD